MLVTLSFMASHYTQGLEFSWRSMLLFSWYRLSADFTHCFGQHSHVINTNVRVQEIWGFIQGYNFNYSTLCLLTLREIYFI